MDGATTQPYIYDCLVHVRDRRAGHAFRIFFKRHCFLPRNSCLNVHGDILVMRAGKRNINAVVNMRNHDAVVADFMAERYFSLCLSILLLINRCRFAAMLQRKAHGRLPHEMIIYKRCT